MSIPAPPTKVDRVLSGGESSSSSPPTEFEATSSSEATASLSLSLPLPLPPPSRRPPIGPLLERLVALERERSCLSSERGRFVAERDMILIELDRRVREVDGKCVRARERGRGRVEESFSPAIRHRPSPAAGKKFQKKAGKKEEVVPPLLLGEYPTAERRGIHFSIMIPSPSPRPSVRPLRSVFDERLTPYLSPLPLPPKKKARS